MTRLLDHFAAYRIKSVFTCPRLLCGALHFLKEAVFLMTKVEAIAHSCKFTQTTTPHDPHGDSQRNNPAAEINTTVAPSGVDNRDTTEPS